MNKIIIIGNGFDLAHDLKTRYSDFILWYFNRILKSLNQSNNIMTEDDLIIFKMNTARITTFESLEHIKNLQRRGVVSISFKDILVQNIVWKSLETTWVDIEYEYFLALVKIYKEMEKHLIDGLPKRNSNPKIENLNHCMDSLTELLKEYLNTINIKQIMPNHTIHSNITKELVEEHHGETIFLVFNYTSTIEMYLNNLNTSNVSTIYIHGKLNDLNNPIIFGYGDEMHEYYRKMQDLNVNGFLRKNKSFMYSETRNYHDLLNILNAGLYSVLIMGHSCGLSDRVLLNTIFCSDNCTSIKIYYHDHKDYTEKYLEMSRHFQLSETANLRYRIVSFPDSQPLGQLLSVK